MSTALEFSWKHINVEYVKNVSSGQASQCDFKHLLWIKSALF